MKLTEFNSKPSLVAKKALKEHFDTSFNVDKLGLYETKTMLNKVKGLLRENRETHTTGSQNNPAYLKLVFMEQALTHHYGELKAMPVYNQRIVVENEEVEKSQVILAAQEMVDSMQKMIEQVSDMLVKELPAVVDGVNSEVGTDQGQQFNDQVTQALTSLQAALAGSKTGLSGALGIITGQAGGAMDMGAGAMPGSDVSVEEPPMDASADLAAPEEPAAPEADLEAPEEPAGPLGRATR
jgi:hypothetical protein